MATATTEYFPGNADVNEAGAILDVWREGSPLQGSSTQVSTTFVNSSGVLLELTFHGHNFGTSAAAVNALSISFNGIVTMQLSGINEYLSTVSDLLNQSVNNGTMLPVIEFLSAYYDNNYVGSGSSDNIVGGLSHDLIVGRGGNDTLDGWDGNDDIFSGAGNDLAYGGAGNDIIGGGTGNDTLAGESGSDTLYGGDGDDLIFVGNLSTTNTDGPGTPNVVWAGSGHDEVVGSGGNDTLGGGIGDDTLWGEGGNDVIYGGKDAESDPGNNDLIYGYVGNDTIYAGNGADFVYGNADNDLIYSGNQNDTVVGGTGEDYIWGGADNDSLYGGNENSDGDGAADVFAFQSGSGEDWVHDFEVGTDYLDLRYTHTEFATPQDVVAASTQYANGVLINLGAGDTVFLADLTQANLQSSNYFF